MSLVQPVLHRRWAFWGALFAALLLFAASASADGGKASPAPSGSAAPPAAAAAHIRDREVFSIKVPHAGRSALDRAKHATEVLEHAVEDPTSGDVHVEQNADVAIVYIGASPVVQLGPEDAAAEGDVSVAVHADFVAARVGDALRAERRRSALARSVFSTSLLVFSALVVFLALGKLGGAIAQSRQWVASRPSGLPAVRIAGIDVVRPVALRGVALGAIDASRWVFGIGLVYVWLLFALSLFETTRPYSERLTGIVLAPLYGFVGRLTSTMPVLFLAAVGGLVLLITLRVIALFFEGVTRGEPALSWLPPDLASPTSVLVRIGLIIVAASAATPLLTGNEEGPLARASLVAMAALALALSPILATAVVGITVLFGRQLKVGDFVELGERAGVVRGLGLLAVTLEDAQGCTVRVPHLGGLLYPTKVKGPMPPVAVEIGVLSKHDIGDVLELLSKVAAGVGIRGRVEVARIGGTETLYRLTVLSASATVRSELLTAAAKALREADIQLGQSSPSLGRR